MYIDIISNRYYLVQYFDKIDAKIFFEREKIKEMRNNLGKTIRVRQESFSKNKCEILGKMEKGKIIIGIPKEINCDKNIIENFNIYHSGIDMNTLDAMLLCMDKSYQSKIEITEKLKKNVIQI